MVRSVRRETIITGLGLSRKGQGIRNSPASFSHLTDHALFGFVVLSVPHDEGEQAHAPWANRTTSARESYQLPALTTVHIWDMHVA